MRLLNTNVIKYQSIGSRLVDFISNFIEIKLLKNSTTMNPIGSINLRTFAKNILLDIKIKLI